MKLSRILATLFAFTWHYCAAQDPAPRGKLFIIGGGERTPTLTRSLLATARMRSGDYVVVLPMSSSMPDSSYWYFKTDFEKYCSYPIINFNFTELKVHDNNWLDSLKQARLIYITGGDQSRFMKIVLHTPVYDAIKDAYVKGATVAGSSAGAAVMSRYMITGNQLTDTVYEATFRKLTDKNIEIKEGLGLLSRAIVDQHFIVRSRYNRLISALASRPALTCIGIDESTAIIVQGAKIRVSGVGQVIVFRKPVQMKVTSTGLIKAKNIQFSIYTDGDEFSY